MTLFIPLQSLTMNPGEYAMLGCFPNVLSIVPSNVPKHVMFPGSIYNLGLFCVDQQVAQHNDAEYIVQVQGQKVESAINNLSKENLSVECANTMQQFTDNHFLIRSQLQLSWEQSIEELNTLFQDCQFRIDNSLLQQVRENQCSKVFSSRFPAYEEIDILFKITTEESQQLEIMEFESSHNFTFRFDVVSFVPREATVNEAILIHKQTLQQQASLLFGNNSEAVCLQIIPHLVMAIYPLPPDFEISKESSYREMWTLREQIHD